jgi:MFS family permease
MRQLRPVPAANDLGMTIRARDSGAASAPLSLIGARDDPEGGGHKRATAILWTLAVTETVSWGVLYYAFAVFQVPMRAELGFSTAETAGAFALMVLVTGLAGVPAGRWLDRHGARALMTAGSLAAVLLVAAWSQVHTLVGLYGVFAGMGLASAAVLYEPAFAVVVRWFTTDRARALLTVTVVAGLASTVFMPASDALITALGWRHALLVLAGVLAVTTVAPHALVLRPSPDFDHVPRIEPARRDESMRATARWALRDPLFGWLTLAFAANTLAVVVVAVHLVPFLREHGHSSAFAATAAGALGALSVTGRLVLTGATRRWSTAGVTSMAFAVQAAAVLALLTSGRSTVGAVLFVVLFGLGFGVGTIARPALLADAYGTSRYATLSALAVVAFTAVKTVGPFAAGLALTATGSWTPVLLGLLVTTLVASVAVARAGRLLAHLSQRAADPTSTAETGADQDQRMSIWRSKVT